MATGVGGADSWQSWHVTEAARDWLTATQDNHGLLVKQAGEDVQNVHTFDYGAEDGGPAVGRRLTLVARGQLGIRSSRCADLPP